MSHLFVFASRAVGPGGPDYPASSVGLVHGWCLKTTHDPKITNSTTSLWAWNTVSVSRCSVEYLRMEKRHPPPLLYWVHWRKRNASLTLARFYLPTLDCICVHPELDNTLLVRASAGDGGDRGSHSSAFAPTVLSDQTEAAHWKLANFLHSQRRLSISQMKVSRWLCSGLKQHIRFKQRWPKNPDTLAGSLDPGCGIRRLLFRIPFLIPEQPSRGRCPCLVWVESSQSWDAFIRKASETTVKQTPASFGASLLIHSVVVVTLQWYFQSPADSWNSWFFHFVLFWGFVFYDH